MDWLCESRKSPYLVSRASNSNWPQNNCVVDTLYGQWCTINTQRPYTVLAVDLLCLYTHIYTKVVICSRGFWTSVSQMVFVFELIIKVRRDHDTPPSTIQSMYVHIHLSNMPFVCETMRGICMRVKTMRSPTWILFCRTEAIFCRFWTAAVCSVYSYIYIYILFTICNLTIRGSLNTRARHITFVFFQWNTH